MSDLKFSKDHEWIKVEGDTAIIGITKHATEMLGDIVFAELPEKGSTLEINIFYLLNDFQKYLELHRLLELYHLESRVL